MKKVLTAVSLALFTCSVAVAAPAQADKKAATAKVAPKKAPAKKTTSPATRKTKTSKRSKTQAKPAASPVAAQPEIAQPEARSNREVFGGYPVIVGELKCDQGTAKLVPTDNDSFQVTLPKRSYVMQRVPTTTGVVRLEDKTRGAYWLQMSNKSMLVDEKAGGRVADGCRNADQQAREEELKKAPVNLLQ